MSVYGLLNYLVVLIACFILIVFGVFLMIKNYKIDSVITATGFFVIIFSIIVGFVLKGYCFGNVKKTYDLDKGTIDKYLNIKIVEKKMLNKIAKSFSSDISYQSKDSLELKNNEIEIFFECYKSTDSAKNSFTVYDKPYQKYYGCMYSKENANGEFFSTYNNQLRSDPEGWYSLSNEFLTEIYIRTGIMKIKLKDRTKDSKNINKYLKEILNIIEEKE
jgi:hypothetical protein